MFYRCISYLIWDQEQESDYKHITLINIILFGLILEIVLSDTMYESIWLNGSCVMCDRREFYTK